MNQREIKRSNNKYSMVFFTEFLIIYKTILVLLNDTPILLSILAGVVTVFVSIGLLERVHIVQTTKETESYTKPRFGIDGKIISSVLSPVFNTIFSRKTNHLLSNEIKDILVTTISAIILMLEISKLSGLALELALIFLTLGYVAIFITNLVSIIEAVRSGEKADK